MAMNKNYVWIIILIGAIILFNLPTGEKVGKKEAVITLDILPNLKTGDPTPYYYGALNRIDHQTLTMMYDDDTGSYGMLEIDFETMPVNISGYSEVCFDFEILEGTYDATTNIQWFRMAGPSYGFDKRYGWDADYGENFLLTSRCVSLSDLDITPENNGKMLDYVEFGFDNYPNPDLLSNVTFRINSFYFKQENLVCGDSYLDTGETCDDGNTASGDGCDASCQIESGWVCDSVAMPSKCTSENFFNVYYTGYVYENDGSTPANKQYVYSVCNGILKPAYTFSNGLYMVHRNNLSEECYNQASIQLCHSWSCINPSIGTATLSGGYYSYTVTGSLPNVPSHSNAGANFPYDGDVNEYFGEVATPVSITYDEGVSGQAIFFDGINSRVEIPGNIIPDSVYGDYTISFWLLNLGSDANWPTILNWNPQSEKTPYWWIYTTGTFESDLNFQYLSIEDWGEDIGDFHTITWNNVLSFNEWQYVTFVYRHLDSEVELYINAVSQGIKSTPRSVSLHTSDNPLYVGTYDGNQGSESNYPFEGMIDELIVYNWELTDSQIQTQYELFNDPSSDGSLVAHYRFDGDLTDSSGSGYDLYQYETGRYVPSDVTFEQGVLSSSVNVRSDDGSNGSSFGVNAATNTLMNTEIFGFNEPLTISTWLRPERHDKDLQYDGTIFQTKWSTSPSGVGVFFRQDTSRIQLSLGDGTTYNNYEFTSTNLANMQPYNWYYVTITIGPGEAKAYLNGVLEDTIIIGDYDSTTSTAFTPTGKSGSHMQGNLDEYKLFDYVLDGTEISTLYSEFSAPPSNEPLPYLLSDADSLTGWTSHSTEGSISLNTNRFLEGTGSINMLLDNTGDAAGADFVFSPKDMSYANQYLSFALYIRDQTALDKIADGVATQFYVNDGTSNWGHWSYPVTEYHIGWNIIVLNPAVKEYYNPLYGYHNFEGSQIPDLTSINRIRIRVWSDTDLDTFEEGEILIDNVVYGDIPDTPETETVTYDDFQRYKDNFIGYTWDINQMATGGNDWVTGEVPSGSKLAKANGEDNFWLWVVGVAILSIYLKKKK